MRLVLIDDTGTVHTVLENITDMQRRNGEYEVHIGGEQLDEASVMQDIYVAHRQALKAQSGL